MLVEELGTWLMGFFFQTISLFSPATAFAEYLEHAAVSDSMVISSSLGKNLNHITIKGLGYIYASLFQLKIIL